jgi:arylsulfatase A-like enzyme
LLVFAAVLWCGTLAASHARADEPEGIKRRPNVLFLFTDDQRSDTIGALGNPHIKTPQLDSLVDSAFVFRNIYCMGSTMGAVCNPSRHMLHSGMSLYRYDPKKKEGTFADTMNLAGYETYHHSKRGNTPHAYHTVYDHSQYLNDQAERTSGHHGKTIADQAVKFLHDREGSKPFFMYLGFSGPHDPRVAAPRWMALYERDAIPLPVNFQPYHPFNNGEMLVRDERLAPWPRTEAVVRKHLHDYYGCISSIDHQIGRILAELRASGEFDNTLIVFSSDHGLAMGSHGLFGKQSLYEHSMKSPLFFSGPGIPKGESPALGYLLDIYPTVCDLIGVSVPEGLDGRSLAPVIRGETQQGRDAIFLAYRDVMRGVRGGDWKLIRYPQVNVTQLFNLKDDPDEMRNLAQQPEYKLRVARMMTLLAQLQEQFDDKAPLEVANPRPAEVDPETFFNQPVPAKKRRQ